MQDTIVCDDFIMDGTVIWFPSKDSNTFYSADLNIKEAKCLWECSDEKSLVTRLFRGIARYKNRIFMFPCEASNIIVYEITENTVTNIELEPRQIQRFYWHNPSKTWFWKVIQAGEYIYAGGMGYRGIIKLNSETLEIEYIDDWSDQVEKSIGSDSDEVYIEDGLLDGDNIYFPLCCMDAMLRLDLQTDTTKLIELNSGLSGFAGIEKWNESFVLLPRQAEEVLIYVPENGSTKKIKIPYEIEKFSVNKVPFEGHFILDDKLYVFRAFCDKNYVVDLKNEIAFENTEEPFGNKKVGAIHFIDDMRLVFIDLDTRSWIIYNVKEQRYEQRFQLKMDLREKRKIIKEKMSCNEGKIWQENDELGLQEYLLYII